eukprot:gene10802-2882_t
MSLTSTAIISISFMISVMITSTTSEHPPTFTLGGGPVPLSTTDNVRSEATHPILTTKKPQLPTNVPPGFIRRKTCSSLRWPTVNGVCGASRINGERLGQESTYTRTIQVCVGLGSRICKIREVKEVMPVPLNQVDNHFRRNFWTVEFCWTENGEPGYFVVSVVGEPQCQQLSQGRADIMCCSDE